MRRLTVAAVACVLAVSGAVFAGPSPDISLLLDELGSNASADLKRDLLATDLFPASGKHRGIPIWNTGPEMPAGGSLAIVYPTAARAGIELQKLKDAGVTYTETPTVQRIIRVTTFWLQLVEQPSFGSITNSLDAAVRRLAESRRAKQTGDAVVEASATTARRGVRGETAAIQPIADQDLVRQAMGTFPDLADRTAIDESSGFTTNAGGYVEIGPKPGEIWCYHVMHGAWNGTEWCCSGPGDNCWVERDCPMR